MRGWEGKEQRRWEGWVRGPGRSQRSPPPPTPSPSVLGTVDKIGTTYEDDFLATGFGMHLAIPIMRSRWRADMNEGEARALLEDCMRVLFYRDCRSVNSIQLAKITADGPLISDPYPLSTRWTFESFVNPHAGSDTGGSW